MTRTTETEEQAAAPASLPEYRPGRVVGWIFREDGCVAIARQGTETHGRGPVD